MEHSADGQPHAAQRLALLAKIDILADLSEPEVNRIVDAAPARTYRAGELLYAPHRPVEVLFLLKRGRIRVFRASPEGRALTTATTTPRPSTRRTPASSAAPMSAGCCCRTRASPRGSWRS